MGEQAYTAALAVDSACTVGEGPVWDARSGALYWIDMAERRFYQYIPATGQVRQMVAPSAISAFALRAGEGLVVAGGAGFYGWDPESGDYAPLGEPEERAASSAFNDGKCDPQGRFLAGTASGSGERDGALYVLEPGRRIRKLEGGIRCSNGISWSGDGRTMYYIDSYAGEVVSYAYDGAAGELSQRTPIIAYPDPDVLPDGMAIDEEGMLWIAEWGGWAVTRWNPRTGRKLATVEVPCQYVTSCAFADGTGLLYITTARSDLSGARLQAQPLSGGVFSVQTDTRGPHTSRFGG